MTEPLHPVFTAIGFTTLSVPELGRLGNRDQFALHGSRPNPFPISMLIRWWDASMEEYLGPDADEKEDLRASFDGQMPKILRNIDQGYGGVRLAR